MHEDRKIDRRAFLKGLALAGTPVILPINNLLAKNTRNDTLERIIDVMEVQARLNDDRLHAENINNVMYAYRQINPTTHLEYAFVVACGSYHDSSFHLVDEYTRRSRGELSRLYDHPIFQLRSWGVPYTQGLLIFREQIDALFKELTNRSWLKHRSYFLVRRASLEEFRQLLAPKYREYKEDEIRCWYDALVYYTPRQRLYAWCSTMADRVLTQSHGSS